VRREASELDVAAEQDDFAAGAACAGVDHASVRLPLLHAAVADAVDLQVAAEIEAPMYPARWTIRTGGWPSSIA
jgi:hypothetical protein